MRFLPIVLPAWLCVATVAGAPVVSNDDDCEIEWFQGTPDASSSSPAKVSVAASTQAAIAAAHTGEPPTSTQDSNEKASPSGVVTSVGDVSKASDTATTNATADTGNLAGTLPTGSYPHGMTVVDTKAWPGHYITGKTLQAPQCEKKVPTGAAIYKSPYPSILDIKHFKAWYENLRDNNLPSKYLKVTPGWYEYKISEGATTIAFGELYKDWTLDLRDVTFVYDATVTKDAGIYLNQCTNFYVCGGTFWNDNSGGEMFTQAKVISAKQADGDLWEYTAIIDQGYDIPKWREASARNVVTMDVSNPTHFKHVEVNFWYSHFPWDVSDDGTIKFQMGKARGMMQEGYMLSLSMIDGSGYCLSNEFTGGVTLDGLTCNGGFSMFGLSGIQKEPSTWKNCLHTNPPPRAGTAPRIHGPMLDHNNFVNADYTGTNEGGVMPRVENSWWQYSGNTHDWQSMAEQEMPKE